DKLIFLPTRAKNIWISDKDLQNWEKIQYKNKLEENAQNIALQGLLYKNKLYIIGANYPAIMCMDSDKKITYIHKPYKRLTEIHNKVKDVYFRKDYVLKDSVLYLASCLDNYVLKLSLDDHNYEWEKVGNRGNRYSGIALSGKKFWLSPRDNMSKIVKWDGQNEVEEIDLPAKFKKCKYPFLGVLCDEKKIFFPGKEQGESIIYSSCGEMTVIKGQYQFCKWFDPGERCEQFVDGSMKYIRRNGETWDVSIEISRDGWRDFIRKNLSGYQLTKESALIRLEDMLKMFSKTEIETYTVNKDFCGDIAWPLVKA
ncbi:MAG TPA: hypothetical protein DF613_01155, partial [Lachnospiraceae bacterium]|nr:hypothetical protein [Lachnospiraceae bacterium]